MTQDKAQAALARLQQQHHDLVGSLGAQLIIVRAELFVARQALDLLTDEVGLNGQGEVLLTAGVVDRLRSLLGRAQVCRDRTQQLYDYPGVT